MTDRTYKHGRHGYKKGCRCDVCRTAQRDYMREYQRRRVAEGRGPLRGVTENRTCQVCGRQFQGERRLHRTCCSKQCAQLVGARASARSQHAKAEAQQQARAEERRRTRRRTQATKKLQAAAQGTKGRCTWRSCQCHVCRTWYITWNRDQTCSSECADKNRRQSRKVHKDRRRARKRAAYVADVYRNKVFTADSYRCHLCGGKTDPTKKPPHIRTRRQLITSYRSRNAEHTSR